MTLYTEKELVVYGLLMFALGVLGTLLYAIIKKR